MRCLTERLPEYLGILLRLRITLPVRPQGGRGIDYSNLDDAVRAVQEKSGGSRRT